MHLRTTTLGLLLGLAACGGDSGAPYTATISGEAVTYAAAQDGDGAWQQLTLDATGTATFEVTRGFHGLAARCGGGLLVRLDAEPEAPWVPCEVATPATTVTVSGSLTPPTAVVWSHLDLFQGNGSSTTYRVEASPGRRDLVAVSSGRALVARDLQLTTDLALDLDVETDGFALTVLTPELSGHGTATPSSYTDFKTANGTYASISLDAFAVVPAAQRVAGDRASIGASIERDGRIELVQRALVGDTAPALAFTPLPALGLDRGGLTWGDGWDFAAVSYRSTTTATTSAQLMVTSGWSAASGLAAAALPDASALPGWDATWGGPTAGAALSADAWAGIGDPSADYQASYVSTALTW